MSHSFNYHKNLNLIIKLTICICVAYTCYWSLYLNYHLKNKCTVLFTKHAFGMCYAYA
jgi:hypothetical protein